MPPEPDTDELARRVCHFEILFEELRQVVNAILEWKNQTTGGLKVTLWGIGMLQSVVLLCLGFAANALNSTATTLGQHAVELGKASTKIDSFAAARESSDEAMRNWVRNEIHNSREKP